MQEVTSAFHMGLAFLSRLFDVRLLGRTTLKKMLARSQCSILPNAASSLEIFIDSLNDWFSFEFQMTIYYFVWSLEGWVQKVQNETLCRAHYHAKCRPFSLTISIWCLLSTIRNWCLSKMLSIRDIFSGRYFRHDIFHSLMFWRKWETPFSFNRIFQSLLMYYF